MMKLKKIMCGFLSLMMIVLCVSVSVFAHSGRTDGSGGHRDNQNKSGLGSYHYHCGGYPPHLHEDGYCPYTDVMPSSVSVNIKKESLGIGEKTKVSASVSPSNACDTSVSWKNSNPDVVNLDNGTIEAVGYGTATITATTFNGKKRSITITVKEITADKVTIQESIKKLYVGDRSKLTAVILPENVDNSTITWTSSDEKVATVDADGNIQALAIGTVTITATASNGVKDSKKIKIKEVVAEKIEIQAASTIVHGDPALAKVTFYPENTTSKEIQWKVSDEHILQIDEKGNIQSLNVGKVTLTAIQKDTSAVFEMEVLPRKVEKIIIKTSIEDKLYPGDTAEFSAEVSPANATYPQVYWKVEDEDVASIDENGHLEATRIGTTNVVAYTEDGCEAIYEIEVNLAMGFVMIPAGLVMAVGVGAVVRKRRVSKN